VSYRADLWNSGTTYKFKQPHPTEGVADEEVATEKQKKKKHEPTTWRDYDRASA
jgi:hypothetical protein